KIRRVFDQWKGTDALKSNLEKNQQLKNVLLEETPWVLDAQGETAAKQRVGLLFDSNTVRVSLASAEKKLSDMQLFDGAWPWFPGGRPSSYITLYIVTGYGRLKHLGVDINTAPAVKALGHLDNWLRLAYEDLKKFNHLDRNNLSQTIALYLYGRSFFLDDKPVAANCREALEYFLAQARQYWLDMGERMSHGHIALGIKRFGDKTTAEKIVASLKERSVSDEELGMYWRDTEDSWWWYRAPIETQALMIEVFDEVSDDKSSMEDCKVWLLKQKQARDWKTTKATADAIYGLLLRGENLLASDRLVEVWLGGENMTPEKAEAGTGYYEKRIEGPLVKPEYGLVELVKHDPGIAWGGLHWQYLEDMTKVTQHGTNLSLKKALFVERDTKQGKTMTQIGHGDILAVGDRMKVRIELRTDRDMEYVHLKDMRGCGTEPENVLSGWRYQDRLAYYESTKDTASHFFIEYLPKGTFVFEYSLMVQHRGRYQSGIANIQCMYAPEFSSHSESFWINVE
ncbi:MAG: alpha-2-macroglobulin family protein, partial [Candidatus Wallbacteria bacterium]|nr:alpha-2-macroglobulin family protein [Candidatus Wallbacteria bacterium]